MSAFTAEELSEFVTIESFIKALKTEEFSPLEQAPELKEGGSLEIAATDYFDYFGLEIPWYSDGPLFAVRATGNQQLTMCWRMQCYCFARLLSENETHRFRELSGSRLDRATPVTSIF